jgi:hypothetical protein
LKVLRTSGGAQTKEGVASEGGGRGVEVEGEGEAGECDTKKGGCCHAESVLFGEVVGSGLEGGGEASGVGCGCGVEDVREVLQVAVGVTVVTARMQACGAILVNRKLGDWSAGKKRKTNAPVILCMHVCMYVCVCVCVCVCVRGGGGKRERE